YLVEPSQQNGDAKKLEYEELTDLKVADLACGSGHILNECFDLLFDLYTFEGYTRKEAVENIFKKNLTGIDLDTRAQQLSKFALLLKACQRDASFADAHCMPKVLTMPKPFDEEKNGNVAGFLHHFFMGNETEDTKKEIVDAYELIRDADSLGSIMKFDISDSTRLALQQMVDYWDSQSFVPEIITEQMPALRLILTLTDKYSALVMNPPYMVSGNMNETLSNYVRSNYVDGKADLFSVFMLLSEDRLLNEGRYGMINMQSWMFLSSFENLRKHILEESVIENMLHLGPRTFDELSGEVVQNTAFIIRVSKPKEGTCGNYYRLVDGKNCSHKEVMFRANEGFYPNIPQSNFNKIPGNPIGYW
ncbi:MAG: N-6 DNA methylase, partial [Bacteroidaceae bacterium]|nr:N-6 DNA methylase [Bacteroidaceae bacterium]